MTQPPPSENVEQGDEGKDTSTVEVSRADLPEAEVTALQDGCGQIDILLDTPMDISACLGSSQMPIRNLLETGPGSVLKLDRKVGEPVDLYLRGIRFATGQLVVVGDQLGVRVEEILNGTAVAHSANAPDRL